MGRRVEVARAGLFVPGMGDLAPGRRFDAEATFGANAAHLVKSGVLRWVDDDEPKPAEKAATKKAAAKPAAEG